MALTYDAVIVGAGHNGLVTAAYLARAGWLQVEDGAMPDDELKDMLRIAHALILGRLPKKLRAELGV